MFTYGKTLVRWYQQYRHKKAQSRFERELSHFVKNQWAEVDIYAPWFRGWLDKVSITPSVVKHFTSETVEARYPNVDAHCLAMIDLLEAVSSGEPLAEGSRPKGPKEPTALWSYYYTNSGERPDLKTVLERQREISALLNNEINKCTKSIDYYERHFKILIEELRSFWIALIRCQLR